tara:strand:+ start:4529 stop:5302 length:774 start_codon:yes stop_codon:yes gene_type:complete
MQGISIITGTLNRKEYLHDLIHNTIATDANVELVLVDGGSTDGSIEYIKSITHPRLKLVEVGKRSSYPHYMNLGIRHASHDFVCQWNDDVLLCNGWRDVLNEIDDEHDAYLFNWKEGSAQDMENENWLRCNHMRDNGWIICNNADHQYPQMVGEKRGEVVMNYGIYKKDVFRRYGMYNQQYQYYCADGEMSMRAYYSGVKFKTCTNIKVCVLPAEKRAIMINEDLRLYSQHCLLYTLPEEMSNKSIKEVFADGEYLE